MNLSTRTILITIFFMKKKTFLTRSDFDFCNQNYCEGQNPANKSPSLPNKCVGRSFDKSLKLIIDLNFQATIRNFDLAPNLKQLETMIKQLCTFRLHVAELLFLSVFVIQHFVQIFVYKNAEEYPWCAF